VTILDLTLLEWALAIAVVAVGTAVQSAVGFGLAMIAAPVLLLIDRDLVPGPLIASALLLVIWVSWRDRHAIDFSHFKAALLGRVLGTPPAALLMGTVSSMAFDLLFGGMVLIAVVISLIHADIRATPGKVFIATLASGFMSTISSIGGPPIALVYQNARGPALRANLSVLFSMGCVVSLSALALVGRFHAREVGYSAGLAIGVGIGLACHGPLKRLIDRQSARPWLLGLCAFSAFLVLGRAFLRL